MQFSFSAPIWRWQGNAPATWHFVTVPPEIAHGVRLMSGAPATAFGSIRVGARIGSKAWKTSLFPDSKSGSYLLPVKAEVRRAVGIAEGDMIEVELSLDL